MSHANLSAHLYAKSGDIYRKLENMQAHFIQIPAHLPGNISDHN